MMGAVGKMGGERRLGWVLSTNQYGGHVKRVRFGSEWALEKSEEGGGTPAMGTVGKMGGEERLGWVLSMIQYGVHVK